MQSISRNKLKSQQSTSTIILKIVSITIKDPRITGQTYAKIINLKNQSNFIQSPIFQIKLGQPWLISINHISEYQLQVYSKIKNKFQFIGSEIIDQLHGCLEYFYEDKPICVWSASYEFIDLKQQQQKKTENNQNVFAEQSFFIDEDISRIKGPTTNEVSMQKIGYHNMQQTMTHKSKVKNQLVDQLERLNKSLMQSFRQYTIQKKLCTNLVDQADSLTKSIIEENNEDESNKQKDNGPVVILEENQEVEEVENTQQNWFKAKFQNQQLKKKFKKRRYLRDSVKQNNSVKFVPSIFNHFNDCHQYRLLHSLDFQDDIKPSQILISTQQKGQQPNKIASLKVDNETLKRWEANISMPIKNAILLQVQEKQGVLYGCIGQEEQTLGCCSLYSQSGQFRGNVQLKIKKIENINIQTEEQLQQMLQTQQIEEQNKQPNQKEAKSEQNKSLIQQQKIEASNIQEMKEPQKVDPCIPQLLYPTFNDPKNPQGQIDHHLFKVNKANKNSPIQNLPKVLALDYLGDYTDHTKMEKVITQPVQSCRLTYDTPTNISNNSVRSNQSVAINRGSLNFKIQSITVQLKKPIYHQKYLKIWMQGYQPYLTQTSNQSSLPFWKGRGYLFQKISRFTILHIEMYRILKDEYIKFEGNCRIYLTELPPEKLQKLNSNYYLMLDKNKQILGNLYIEYKFIDKKNVYQSSRKFKDINHGPESKIQTPTQQSAIRTKRERIKTDPNLEGNDHSHCIFRSKIKQRGMCCSLHKSTHLTPRRGSKGGNIIIPKAKKFSSIKNRERGDPGPGTYHISSHFDRYKSTDI